MALKDLLEEYGIEIWTQGNNVSPGFVNMRCVWCDDHSNHLGLSLQREYFHCWRCGWHPVEETIAKLLNVNLRTARQLVRQYRSTPSVPVETPSVPATSAPSKPFRFPPNTGPLQPAHRKYLRARRFSPAELCSTWNIQGIGAGGILDGVNYSHRILIPIYWQGRVVSFQTRAITKTQYRYISCPKPREIIHYKHILYIHPEWQERWGICVEGPTDVWRLGKCAFSLFGISYTHKQVMCIAQRFDKVAILFDPEPDAQEQARKLASELSLAGVKVIVLQGIKGKDPASLNETEIKSLIANVSEKLGIPR